MLRQNPDSHQKMRRRYFDSFFPHGQSQLDSILSILYLASRLTLTQPPLAYENPIAAGQVVLACRTVAFLTSEHELTTLSLLAWEGETGVSRAQVYL